MSIRSFTNTTYLLYNILKKSKYKNLGRAIHEIAMTPHKLKPQQQTTKRKETKPWLTTQRTPQARRTHRTQQLLKSGESLKKEQFKRQSLT